MLTNKDVSFEQPGPDHTTFCRNYKGTVILSHDVLLNSSGSSWIVVGQIKPN